MPRKAVAKSKVDKQQDKKIQALTRKLEPEYKYYSTFDGNGGIYQGRTNAMATFNLTSAIAQGDAVNERTGNQIFVHRIKVDVLAVMNSATVENGNFVRVILVQNNQYDGTQLVGQEVLLNYTTTDLATYNAVSVWNPAYISSKLTGKKGVRVLWDKMVHFGSLLTLPTVSQTLGGTIQAHLKFDKIFKKPLRVQYDGANARAGNIYMFMFPGYDTTAAYNPDVTNQQTVWYTDD